MRLIISTLALCVGLAFGNKSDVCLAEWTDTFKRLTDHRDVAAMEAVTPNLKGLSASEFGGQWGQSERR